MSAKSKITSPTANFSVFVAESVRAEDFYHGQTDGLSSHQVLHLSGVRSTYRIVIDDSHLRRAVRDAVAGDYLALHVSCHGDHTGLELTDGTEVDWEQFAEMVRPFARNDRILVLSSCGGGHVSLSKMLFEKDVVFGWLFGATAKRVGFEHSYLAWSVVYGSIVNARIKRRKIQRALDNINAVLPGRFIYRRWDGSKYRVYPSVGTRRKIR